MADLRIVDAPVLLQESITDDVKMPTGGLGNFSVRLGDILWYVITKEQLANKNYVDLSSKGVKDSLDEHIADKANPHQVTKAQVGLGNVDNTADVDKPVSDATKSAIITATTDMATKTYVNQKDNLKADKATTLSGYGIIDAYTKSEIDTNYAGVKTLYDKNVEAGAGANGWDDTLVAAGENLNQRQVNDGLDSIAQLAGIQNPRNGMRVYVKSYHAGLNKGGGTFIYDAGKANVNDGGLVLNGWVRQNYSVLKPEFWGADPHNQVDCSAAFNKMFIAAKGLSVELDGHYKFTSPIVVDYEDAGSLKIVGQGSGIHNTINGQQKTVLDFNSLPANSTALTFKRVRGLYLNGFHISHNTAFDDSSISMWITTLDMFDISDITIYNTNGADSTGIQFGKTDGHDCAFMGTVRNCDIRMSGGRATSIMPACTTINHINCYQQGGYFYSYKSQYCKYDNCASEGSPSFGYIAEDTKSLTYISCAGEANALGVFTVKRGCSNIEYISPYGAANKGFFGTLLLIDGRYGYNANIKVSNPVSLVNPYAQYDIYSDGVNGIVEVSNVYAPNLPHNIGGLDAWKQNCLIITGDNVVDSTFTPVLSGFIASTQPNATASYDRSGRNVQIAIRVTPTTSTTTNSATTITIPTFGGLNQDFGASIVGVDGTNYGNCIVSSSGVIQMPVISTAFTTTLVISLTLSTNHAFG